MAERRGRGGKTARAEIVRRPAGRLKKLPAGYPALLDDLKQRIRAAQVKAALAVNRDLIALYWQIGKSIAERQRSEGWGKSVVDRLATDLQRAFPGMEGFSPRNIWRMRAFYLTWTSEGLAQPVRESDRKTLTHLRQDRRATFCHSLWQKIPWGHSPGAPRCQHALIPSPAHGAVRGGIPTAWHWLRRWVRPPRLFGADPSQELLRTVRLLPGRCRRGCRYTRYWR